MRRWIGEERIRKQKWLARLGTRVHRPGLWRYNRRAIAKGLAIGLFVAFIPLPCQMLLAAIGAAWSNSNLPVSVAAVWLTNPITIPPLFYLAFRVGASLLGYELHAPADWSLQSVLHLAGEAVGPFLAGCLITGLVAALAGYVAVEAIWRVRIWRRWRRRYAHALAR